MAFMRKRGKKWYYTLEIGSGDQRKRVERVGGMTKAECEKAYRAAMAELDKGKAYKEPARLSVQELFEEWQAGYATNNMREATVDVYARMYKQHIAPTLASRPIAALAAREVQELLNRKKTEGLSRSTVQIIRATLRSIYRYAAGLCGYVDSSPVEGTILPSYEEPPRKARPFTPEQLSDVLAHFAHSQRAHMAMLLSYHTGMRRGECLALKWADVDMEARTIFVHATMHGHVKGAPPHVQNVPKTSSGCRTISFGEKLHKLLRAERASQYANKLKYGSRYADNDAVCCLEDGTMLDDSALGAFNAYCRKKCPGLSFHSLRHTHATMLIELPLCYVV